MQRLLFFLRQKKPPGWHVKPFNAWVEMVISMNIPTGRLWRDAKLYEIGAGTSEIRRMLIGRELFEESESHKRGYTVAGFQTQLNAE